MLRLYVYIILITYTSISYSQISIIKNINNDFIYMGINNEICFTILDTTSPCYIIINNNDTLNFNNCLSINPTNYSYRNSMTYSPMKIDIFDLYFNNISNFQLNIYNLPEPFFFFKQQSLNKIILDTLFFKFQDQCAFLNNRAKLIEFSISLYNENDLLINDYINTGSKILSDIKNDIFSIAKKEWKIRIYMIKIEIDDIEHVFYNNYSISIRHLSF